MAKVLRIDHVAILVGDLETTLSFWCEALGMELAQTKEIPAEMAEIAFLPTGGSEGRAGAADNGRLLGWRVTWKSAARACTTFVWKWTIWKGCWRS